MKSIVAGVGAVFLWSAIPALVKLGSLNQDISFLIVLRFAVSTLIFIPLLPRVFAKCRFISWKMLLLLATTLACNFFFQGLAMKELPASWYIVIFSLNPILVLVAFGVRLNLRLMVWTTIPLLGTFLFIEGGGGWQFSALAMIYLVFGMLTWVLYTILLKKIQVHINDLEITALTQVAALVGSIVIWLARSAPHQILSREDLFSIVVLGISTPLAYFGFSYCLRRTPVFGIVSQYLEPVFGVIIGVLAFHESLNLAQGLGALAIVWGTSQLSRHS